MANTDPPERSSPPYIPFSTFLNFVERLKSTATPTKIDNSVMPNLAGGVRGQVRSALRFLDLTDSEDHVTATFKELIQAHGTDSWGAHLGSVIEVAYEPILCGLDLAGATPGQLQAKFKVAGATGQMADKTIRFLLAALESAGRAFSPHLSNRSAITSSRPSRRSGRPRGDAREREPDQGEAVEDASANGSAVKTRSFAFPVPGEPDIRVVVSETLDDLDVWDMVDATIRAYIGLNEKRGRGANREEDGE